MGVLCRHSHESPIAPGLSTGPCRVSNLLGLSKTQGGGKTFASRGAGERQSDLYLVILKCPRAPTFLLGQLRALELPYLAARKIAIFDSSF